MVERVLRDAFHATTVPKRTLPRDVIWEESLRYKIRAESVSASERDSAQIR